MIRLFIAFLALAPACSAEEFFRFNATKPRKPGFMDVARGENGPILAVVRTTKSRTRPYLHPLYSPDGKHVLTEFAPGHHKHQTGLYWGLTRINGRDYFQKKNQEGEGQPAKWIDLAMQIEGLDEMAHIATIDHPQNPGHPTLWRIDGQFGVGPALARRGDITIPKGQKKTYRYRLVVYQGDLDRAKVEEESKAFGLLHR